MGFAKGRTPPRELRGDEPGGGTAGDGGGAGIAVQSSMSASPSGTETLSSVVFLRAIVVFAGDGRPDRGKVLVGSGAGGSSGRMSGSPASAASLALSAASPALTSVGPLGTRGAGPRPVPVLSLGRSPSGG
jgi:hypothetical protein